MAKKVAKALKPSTSKSAKPTKSRASMKKTELFTILAEAAQIRKNQVEALFTSLSDVIASQLSKKGPQQFIIPGIAKIVVRHKPATKARKGVNGLTGQEMIVKAKPARNVVKIRPLKKLKEMV
jgi:nucleoid DNA-binding protein